MYKHIVMWEFGNVENALEEAANYKREIEDLVGRVKGLVSCSAHYNMADGINVNMVLECVFENLEDLVNYRTDKNHRNVGDKYKGKLLINKKVADFKI